MEINRWQRFTVAAAIGDRAARSAASFSAWVSTSDTLLAFQKCATLLLDTQESLCTSAEQAETVLTVISHTGLTAALSHFMLGSAIAHTLRSRLQALLAKTMGKSCHS